MDYASLEALAARFKAELLQHKAAITDVPWYRYDSFGNIILLQDVISAADISAACSSGQAVLDLGAADGDLAFFLERTFGSAVVAVDNAPTNHNGLRGFRALKRALGSSVELLEVDLDQYFYIDGRYDFAFFLGILYHLKNPYYVLEHLAGIAREMVLSTRITRLSGKNGADISSAACACLSDPTKGNGDYTNFWIFTEAGLRHILERTGWRVAALKSYGVLDSDPDSIEGDQRAFCHIKSVRFRA